MTFSGLKILLNANPVETATFQIQLLRFGSWRNRHFYVFEKMPG
mgnify:CR=1 FL=1